MDHSICDRNDEEGCQKVQNLFREFESLCGMESHFEMCKKSLSFGKCKKVFDNVKSFEIHINVCSGESQYTCYVCGKKFDDDVTCSDHIKNCTGKLLCKNCEMKFGHWKMLLEHYKKCHGKLFVTYVLDYFIQDQNYLNIWKNTKLFLLFLNFICFDLLYGYH